MTHQILFLNNRIDSYIYKYNHNKYLSIAYNNYRLAYLEEKHKTEIIISNFKHPRHYPMSVYMSRRFGQTSIKIREYMYNKTLSLCRKIMNFDGKCNHGKRCMSEWSFYEAPLGVSNGNVWGSDPSSIVTIEYIKKLSSYKPKSVTVNTRIPNSFSYCKSWTNMSN